MSGRRKRWRQILSSPGPPTLLCVHGYFGGPRKPRGTIFSAPHSPHRAATRRSRRRLSRIAKGLTTRCSKQAHARIAKGGGLITLRFQSYGAWVAYSSPPSPRDHCGKLRSRAGDRTEDSGRSRQARGSGAISLIQYFTDPIFSRPRHVTWFGRDCLYRPVSHRRTAALRECACPLPEPNPAKRIVAATAFSGGLP